MRFIKQTNGFAEILSARLSGALNKYSRVVWLVSGGSNIPISARAMTMLDDELSAKLTILETDERFVPLESPDCNWKQLLDAGFDTKQVRVFPVLDGSKSGLEETARRYAEIIREEFDRANFILGQFGIGADGHIAGIKPNSIATEVDHLVCGYRAEDFERVTLTFPAIRKIDEAVVFAFGDEKQEALEHVRANGLSLENVPARILNEIAESFIYNDFINSD